MFRSLFVLVLKSPRDIFFKTGCDSEGVNGIVHLVSQVTAAKSSATALRDKTRKLTNFNQGNVFSANLSCGCRAGVRIVTALHLFGEL